MNEALASGAGPGVRYGEKITMVTQPPGQQPDPWNDAPEEPADKPAPSVKEPEEPGEQPDPWNDAPEEPADKPDPWND
jgi:hypothetical protein